MARTKQTARKITGVKLPRKSHASKKTVRKSTIESDVKNEPNYESMTIPELKKLIPSNKIVSSRPGKPPLKADIIESIRNYKSGASESKSSESKSKESKSIESNSSESKSTEGSSKKIKVSKTKCVDEKKKNVKSSERKSKISNEGMVVHIWTKEDYEYNPEFGGQTRTYFSATPYFYSGTPKQLNPSIDSLLKIFRYHLKSKNDKTEYSDEDLIHEVLSNPSSPIFFNDNIYYFEVANAVYI
jgi:hypothetical protein